MSTVLITGGTGLLGTALRQVLLEKGYQVIVLTRKLPADTDPSSPLQYALWNVEEQTIDTTAIARADMIIHLAGENLGGRRWTLKQKKKIVDSRVCSSRLLVDILASVSNKIKTVVSVSGIGWYGEDRSAGGHHSFVETDPPANDFLGNVCKQWEESITPVTKQGIRLVKFRIGVVLSNKGGALKEFLKPLKWGIAAILGNGKQVISWIHIDDVVSLFVAALKNEKMNGVYNAVAPSPVSNRDLVIKLAKSRKKFFIPVRVPAFILKWVVGEMSKEVLKSTTVSCSKITDTGFQFRFPSIEQALRK
jgi:uncharacterized protein